jgi:Uma2 family endonuclease
MVFVPQKSLAQEESSFLPETALPTMYDLPSEDPEEPGLPDEFHDLQPQLLSRTLYLLNYIRQNYFTASDLNLYYDLTHRQWYKRPDWFLVVDVPHLYQEKELRRSYVIWQEKKSPAVVVEFISPGTESEDLGRFYEEGSNGEQQIDEPQVENPARPSSPKPPGKFEVYEKYLRVPHYIVYSRYTQQLRYFKLEGQEYREQSLQAENPRIWLTDLEIGLGIWPGEFEGVPSHWLRWCDGEGNWLLTDTEQERLEKEQALDRVEQERLGKEQALERVEQECLEKEQAREQLRQAARNLLAAGMPVSQVAQILGLSEAQIREFDR